ncbi:hypothetical protein ZEAMMB73_Zm00001d013371 [Zea mays]|nr:hypothetical protein ZEAMMB73_Zm00001d013371 [Zea mays]
MLTLDPSQRISAKDALDAEYFWTDPLPCDPKSLPKYEASHEFQTKKKRQQQRQAEEAAKRQKLNHPPPHSRLPPIQQPGQAHPQIRPGQGMHNVPPVAAGPGHHYTKPRGPGGPNRYPPGGNQGGGYNPNRGGQGGGYGSGPYPQQGRGPPYPGGGMGQRWQWLWSWRSKLPTGWSIWRVRSRPRIKLLPGWWFPQSAAVWELAITWH